MSFAVAILDALLLVSPDAESTDSVSGLAVDGSLTAQLFKHLCRTGETITRLADGDVEDELLDAELPHGVGGLGVGLSWLLVCAEQLAMVVRCVPW